MLTTSSLRSLRGSLVTTFALAAAALLVFTPVLQAQAPSKTYFVPVYESDFAAAMQILEDDDFGVVENVETVVSIVATVDGTVVYYDHVEDGYELDIGDPMQPTTQVWNLDSGDVLGLRNSVPGTGPVSGTFPYSGGDRIATSRTVAVTRVGWDAEVGTVIAGAFEVLDTGVWGTEYVAPVGEDVASFSMFEKTFLYVMAKETTNVSVVYPGQPAQNFVLPQGGSLALPNVTLGTRVTADAPVQAHVIVGDTRPEGSLEMRCYTLYPVEAWSASYFSPVGNSTLTNDLTTIWLYNDGGSAIAVNFDTQGVADDASFPVGAGSVVPFDMPVALGGEFSSSDGPFYALATVNSPENQAVSGVEPDNDTWDWGFTLVPSSQLSPMAIVGWGPGEKDTPLDQNGSPVWVTAPANTTVYISYNGDLVEEASVAILAFESLKIFDPDNDQTGLRVFTRSELGQPPVPLAVAWGEDPDTAGPGNPYLDLGTTVLPIRALGLLKEAFLEDDVDVDGVTSPGDTLLYELKVINEGTATVHNVVLADEVPAYTTYVAGSTTIDGIPIPDDDTGEGADTEFPLDEMGLDLGDLGVGEEVVVTFEVAIDDPIPTDVNTIRNMAVVSSDETPPTIVEVEDPVIDPAIHLEKTVLAGAGDETQCPGSEEIISEDGETVTYCFEISNEGNVALTLSFQDLDLTIDLSDLLPVDDSALAVGETRTYYYQATVNGAWFDVDGNFENTAEVSGEPLDPNGDPIPDAPNPSDDDTANLTEARPELGLVKSSTTTDVTAAGQVVPYSYDLTNIGNVELTNVTLTDDNTDAVPVCDWAQSSDGATPAGVLSVGETVTCTAVHTVTQAEIDAGGDLTNIAVADSAETDEVTDRLDIPITQDPDLSVEKSSTTEEVTEAGQVVPYSYLVTNIGNMTLTNLTISDNNVDATPTCDWAGSSDGDTEVGILSPGEVVTCSAVRTVSQQEMDAGGFLSNVVTVDSDETGPKEDDLDIPITQNPVLALEKSTLTTEVSALGAVPYTYVVTNNGNVTLTNVTLVDDNTDAVPTCDWAASTDPLTDEGVLSPGEVVSCAAEHTVTQGELDLGEPLVNIATADSEETGQVKDTVSIPIVRMPVLLVLKTSLTTQVTFAGQVVDYSYKVTNDGNVTLTNITVTDNNVDEPPGVDCAGVTMLAPGAMTICTAQRTVTQAEIDAGGNLTNTVIADSAETDPMEDDLEIPIVKTPGIAFDKYVVYTGDLDESGGFTPGDTVTYFGYEVTNPSDVDNLDPTTVPDPGAGIYLLAPAKSCDQAVLLPGETTFCVATYVLSDGDLPVPDSMIDADSDGEVSVGDTLSYQFAVLNTGNVTLTDLEVLDPNAPPTCGVTELAPAASTICEAIYIVTQDDADAGSITNTAVATTNETPPVDDTEVLPVPQNPALTLDKTADVSTYSAVDDVITYSYVVTNTGNVTLNNVTLVDPLPGLSAVTCAPEQPSVLAPTGEMTCSATFSITQADLNAGSVVNVATADSDETDPVDDTVTVDANQTPALTLDKTADVSTYNAVGDVIAYSYVVTNTGNVTLNNVTLVDPLPGLSAVTCAPEQPSVLAPTGEMTCSATYSITQADLDAGSVLNTATADSDETDPVDDSVTVNADQNPALTLDKTADVSTYNAVGEVIAYSYVVTNTGNVTLNNVTLADPLPGLGTITCVDSQPSVLAPGGVMTCSASYTIGQGDLNAGSVVNTATADSNETDPVDDTVTVGATQSPALTLVKTATPPTYSAVGDMIDYSYLVTNTGNVSLAGPVSVADDKATATCPAVSTVGNLDGALDPGESVTCSATYLITQGDLNAGSVTNVATASADGTTSNQDQQTVTANQSPALTLVKTATPPTYSAVGDMIDYSYLVTNTGNVSLSGPVTVADDKATATCPDVSTVGNNDTFLDPGESVTCSATYLITQGDLNAGSVTNMATASADGVDSNQDQETVTANQSPALTLVKTATPSTYSAVGDMIDYSYLVTNTGNVSLSGPVTVADDKATVTCPDVSTVGNNDTFLDPGESVTCEATYSITQDDLNAGSVTNMATASADGVDSNQDQETVTANQSPALTLVKTATPSTYSSTTDVISYSYLVTNSGNVSLSGPVTVADDKATVTCPDVSTVGNNDTFLDPGESVTCEATYSITQDDLNAGSVTNMATASADGVDSNEDEETVTANQSPALTLVKTATPSTYSSTTDVISYSYLVTNSGNVSLSGPVTVADDKATVTCPDVSTVGNNDTFLDPGESVTCEATYSITQDDLNAGSVTNMATASADGVDSNEDEETVTANQSPALTLVKTATPSTYSSTTDVISYSYLVTNSGNVSLSGPVTVADDKATVTCPDVSTVGNNDTFLDPGESVTCEATYSITQDDLNAGSVTNMATASADGVSSNQDQETVTAQVARVTLVKVLSPFEDGGRFNLLANGIPVATNVGNGQGSMLIAPGPLVVSEIGYDSNTDLADYNTNVACFDDATGAELGSAADTTLTLAQSLVADQAVTCTFINFRLSILTGDIRVIKTVNGETPDGQAFTFEIRTGTTAEDPGATIGGPEVLGPPTYELIFNVPTSPDYFLCEVGGNYEWLPFDGAENAFNPGDGDGGVDYGTVCLQVEPEITGMEINVDNGLRNDPRTIGYWGNHCEPNGNGNDDLTKSFIRDLVAGLDGRSGFSFVDPEFGTMNMGLGFVLGSNWTPDGLRTLETRKGQPGGGGPPPAAVEYFQLWNLLPEEPGDPTALDCATLTRILNMRDLDGKKFAEDPAYKIASQLFAAELNQLNDAVRCQGVLNAIDDARDLLETVGFTGYGGFAGAIEDREWTQQAIDLAETLDLYNNSNFAAACDYEPFDYSIDPLIP